MSEHRPYRSSSQETCAQRQQFHRPAHERSGAEVPLLIIITLVSLIFVLGLYALKQEDAMKPAAEERQQQLDSASESRVLRHAPRVERGSPAAGL